MTNKTLRERVKRWLRKLRADEAGNVLVVVALALVPIVGLVGAGVDYSRASAAKTAMQAAVDATALMLSKDAQSLPPEQLGERATDYFNATFNHPEVTNVSITQNYTASAGNFRLEVNGTGKAPPPSAGCSGSRISTSPSARRWSGESRSSNSRSRSTTPGRWRRAAR